MKRSIIGKITAIILLALVTGFIDLPAQKHQEILKYTPEDVQKTKEAILLAEANETEAPVTFSDRFKTFLFDSKVHLGLDLQGGTQLDYKIDLRKVPASDRESIIEGVEEVINRRVNNLGVSEPNIYLSKIADEQHIVVELAGIKDIEEAKKTVGKTIQLEFKEERTTPEPPDKVEEIKKQAEIGLEKVKNGKTTFEQLAEEESKASPSNISYSGDFFSGFEDTIIKEELKKAVSETENGQVVARLIEITESDNEITLQAGSLSPRANKGYAIYKVVEKKQEDREIKLPKEVEARHILISFAGAKDASTDITHTKTEAEIRAQEVLKKLKDGGRFEELVQEYSDDPTTKDKGGTLSPAITEGKDNYVSGFRDTVLKLTEDNKIAEIIETEYGYHIVEGTKITESTTEKRTDTRIKLGRIMYSTLPNPWQSTELSGEHFVRANVAFTNLLQPYVQIQFNDEGADLFEKLTERNVGKPLAIFVGGDLISAPRVNEKISGGNAQITGQFTTDEAQELARDLNTGAIPAPITLSGQYSIGASLGENALKTSLKAGYIGIFLLALFLLLYYRLPGLVANIALSIYGILLVFLLKVSMPLAVALFLSTIVFITLVVKILKQQESFWEKLISFTLACFILFFLTYLLTSSVVLTLAGIAGIILSMGMAVDANILIFERMKEELRNGRPLNAAIEVGFERAWSSIKDSNFSSLITCVILFYFGSSIIRGFAFNLATGILVSMFTAITISKTLLQLLVQTESEKKLWLFGVNKNKQPLNLQIMNRKKSWFSLSGTLIVISLISLALFGLKPALDFTGGTLMELKFENPPTIDQLKQSISEAEKGLQEELKTTAEKPEETKDSAETVITEDQSEKSSAIEFGSPTILPSGEKTLIVRIKHIDSYTHDKLVQNLESKFGKIEETRFTTVGPTIGKTLVKKAFIALLMAMLMIIIYIAFAFRHVPKYVNPWRFGVCAIIALFHDVTITLGLFSLLGKFGGVEVDALFITALLTIIGFSVHDTIVVFDRLRENLKFQKGDKSFDQIANNAVNQTMARSINTSVTTLITLASLLLFGSEAIKYFILALFFGIIVGTYSSIFTATPLLVVWRNWKSR